MRRTAIRRRSPTKRVIDKTRVLNRGYKTPAWFNDIKPGSHGNTPVQKRFWRAVSEHVRQRDFALYGKCVSCNTRFERWQDSQAGHWLPFSLCNAWYKFDPQNIAAQCSSCNTSLHRSGAHVGHAMGEELKRRHGDNILNTILLNNEKYRGQQMQTWEIVEKVAKLAPHLVHD